MSENLNEESIRRYEILTGLVLLSLTFGIFVVGEFGLRLIQFAKFGVEAEVESSSAFYKDEKTGLRLIKPNQQLGKIQINNVGFRGPDIDKKEKNTIRILFLGSSTTYDAGSPEKLNWPHKTVTLLKNKLSQCDIDFINAGQPGFGTKNITILYNNKLKQHNADIAILLPGDINQDLDWLVTEQGFDDVHYHQSPLAKVSVLWAKLEMNFRIIKLQRNAFNQAGKIKIDLPVLQSRFKKRIELLTNSLVNDGILVQVIKIGSQMRKEQTLAQQLKAGNTAMFYMPYVALQDIIKTREGYNQIIEDSASSLNYEVLNSSLGVPADRQHYSDTIHFTTQGAAIMASLMVDEMLLKPKFNQLLVQKGCLRQ